MMHAAFWETPTFPKGVQGSNLGANNFRADINNIIEAVLVLHCQIVEPANERKCKEALNVRRVHGT